MKLSNKDGGALASAEEVEGRRLAKGNSDQRTRYRTQCREDLQHELERIRQALIRIRSILILISACAFLPKAGAQCGSPARWDLSGGRRVTGVPTGITLK